MQTTDTRDETAPSDSEARRDAQSLLSLSRSARSLHDDMQLHEALWAVPDDAVLDADQRLTVLYLFDRVLDLLIAFDSLGARYERFWRTDPLDDGVRHTRDCVLAYAAYFERLALGLEFASHTLDRPQFEALLDEGSHEVGVAPDAYARFRWDVVHVEHLPRVFAARNYTKLMRLTWGDALERDELMAAVFAAHDAAYRRVKGRMAREGSSMLLDSGLGLLRAAQRVALLPATREVATWFGDTRVHRVDEALITDAQVAEITAESRPGDIVVERRNWFLSNLGLPGFWPHAALWVGSAEELAAFLDGDPDVRREFGGAFTAHLRERFPEAWAEFTTLDEHGHPRRILEAVSEGVVFASAEHSLGADYAAAMRPRRTPIEVARAIEHGFAWHGRPYDFHFDIHSDGALYCSELVAKSWGPRVGFRGLQIRPVRILGKTTVTPNDLVAQFDETFGTDAQELDFAWFLDGRESDRAAFRADVDAFRASHRRPKWDISQE